MAAKKRRKSKARSRRKTKRRSRKRTKRRSKRKPFGGYAIKFAGRKESLEQVFGKKPVTPSEMTKKIWSFVKSRRLSTK